MNRNIQIVYIVFAGVCLFAIVAVFGIRTYVSQRRGIETSRAHVEALENTVVSAYLARGGFRSEYFSNRIEDYFRKNPSVDVLSIFSDSTTYYVFARSDTYLTPEVLSSGTWNGGESLFYKPFFKRYQVAPLSLPDVEDASFGILANVMSRELLYRYMRDSLIALVALLLITVVFMIATAEARSSSSTSAPSEEASSPGPLPSAEEEPKRTEHLNAFRSETDLPGDSSGTKEGCGLFSPVTGLGWGNYLEKRLSFELRRAASFDQDLSLLLIKSRDFDRSSAGYAALAKALLKKFSFQDLIFEYGERGFAVILPNADLDLSMREAEDFISKNCSKLSMESCSFTVGLSSRNGRLVNGSRIITEAAQALRKAESDKDHHIIAFRSDPEKYRQYIASRVQ
jgi:GGDEF domain-containing protein